MRRVRQLSSLVLAGTGVLLAIAGTQLGLQGPYGPGPGFLAFWVGLPLAILSVLWLGQVSLGRAEPPAAAESEPRGGRRVAAILAALVAFALLLTSLGFQLTMLALLLFLFFAFERGHVLVKLTVALAGSVGTYHVFEQALRVPLPASSLPVLRALGF